MLKVLMATSEAVPFAKTGGLADVAGTLPAAIDRESADVRIIMPKYGCIAKQYTDRMQFVAHINVQLGWRNQYCGIFSLVENGITVYFIDNEFYFIADHLYGYIHEDVERFAFFSRAVLSVLPTLDFQPDIIHCNDWQTAAIPVLLKAQFQDNPFYWRIRTILTIHNLRYQGVWDLFAVGDVFGLDDSYKSPDKLEQNGNLNILKGGIAYADYVTTVSPTYANEIKTPEYGEGLDGLIRARSGQLCGILNGISYDEYNPTSDTLIAQRYNRRDFVSGKRVNKLSLQQDFGLRPRPDVLMLGMVSRLTSQKGFDLLAQIIASLAERDIQLVVLGTGETRYETMLSWFAGKYPDRIGAAICFDNALAHRIYASCDAFLMPSAFEPCGLSQIISLKYGTLPIVRETGGLIDTVQPYNQYTGEGTGFSFGPYDSHDLWNVLCYVQDVYHDKSAWQGLQRRAMAADFSWKVSAAAYLELYRRVSGTL